MLYDTVCSVVQCMFDPPDTVDFHVLTSKHDVCVLTKLLGCYHAQPSYCASPGPLLCLQ